MDCENTLVKYLVDKCRRAGDLLTDSNILYQLLIMTDDDIKRAMSWIEHEISH